MQPLKCSAFIYMYLCFYYCDCPPLYCSYTQSFQSLSNALRSVATTCQIFLPPSGARRIQVVGGRDWRMLTETGRQKRVAASEWRALRGDRKLWQLVVVQWRASEGAGKLLQVAAVQRFYIMHILVFSISFLVQKIG